MNNAKILNNFKPFDGMKKMYKGKNYPYANCVYDSMLTVAKYYNKNILPILNNVIFIYRFDSEKLNNIGYFKLEVVNIKERDELLNDIGIVINAKSPKIDCLYNEIINSISNGSPIEIYIDMFFQEGRRFYYNKKHGAHSVLVHGYDITSNTLYTIDDITDYKEYYSSFTEFQNYCKGLFENCGFIDKENYFFEYSLNSTVNNNLLTQEELIHLYITDFVNNMFLYQNDIIESLQNIKYLSDNYEYIMKENIEDMIETLNSTIYRKHSEKFRLNNLYKHNFDVLNARKKIDILIDEIIKDWMVVRAFSIKAISLQKFSKEICNECINLIKKIYEREMKYNEILFSMLNAWKIK